MSILIKGMEMPETLKVMTIYSDGNVFCSKANFKAVELPTIEDLMEPMCDQCQWPGWYKDPDDMEREKCSRCPVEAKLAEVLYDND